MTKPLYHSAALRPPQYSFAATSVFILYFVLSLRYEIKIIVDTISVLLIDYFMNMKLIWNENCKYKPHHGVEYLFCEKQD